MGTRQTLSVSLYHYGRRGYDRRLFCHACIYLGEDYRRRYYFFQEHRRLSCGKHCKDTHYGLFSRKDAEGRKQWEAECLGTVEHLYNVPSLAVWVPFNEAWGQFDAVRIANEIKEKDPSRLVDHASGWFDQKGGDFRSVHNYFRPLKVEYDAKRAFVISEYGGYACHIKGHSSADRVYGYQKYDTTQDLTAAYRNLLRNQLFPLEEQGLSGAVYTQLSDVEEEVNGLVTYDRKVVKMPFNIS